jgi:hypothetical protein
LEQFIEHKLEDLLTSKQWHDHCGTMLITEQFFPQFKEYCEAISQFYKMEVQDPHNSDKRTQHLPDWPMELVAEHFTHHIGHSKNNL